MRFLVDENLPGEIAEILIQAGHDAVDVGASNLRGSDDGAVCRTAEQESRILITRDLDFPLPIELGRPPGLVLLRPRPHDRTRELVQLFRAFLANVEAGSLVGTITVVEPGRVRQRAWARLPRR